MKRYLKNFNRILKKSVGDPKVFSRILNTVPAIYDSYKYTQNYKEEIKKPKQDSENPTNPLTDYFLAHQEGLGIFKWLHYFDVYHKHFAKFIGQKVNILEIGIFSGGSLEMWRSYFGDSCHIYGVDIEESCKSYESEQISIYTGNQEDRNFWAKFKNEVDNIDIIIDDGGHTAEQQQVTLEEMLPVLNPGGVYVCEDIHRHFNRFTAYACGLIDELNQLEAEPGMIHESRVSTFQKSINSIHFYPYMMVIEKQAAPLERLYSEKKGTQWHPFIGK